jgi:hypothetical protein
MLSSYKLQTDYIQDALSNILPVFIYNDNLKARDEFIDMTSKNISDYYVMEFSMLKIDSAVATSLEEALEKCRYYNKKYLLYIEVGNLIEWSEKFISSIVNQITAKTKFLGHILDYGNGSFYIHPQFFLIDVEWASENGVLNILPEEKNVNWKGNVIKRSSKNFHDHYTPKELIATTATWNYLGRGRGWNIIQKLAETNSIFSPWNEEVRNKKIFLYPTVQEEATKLKGEIIKYASAHTTFIANTEIIDFKKFDSILENTPEIDIFITPASGISTFLYPYFLKSKKVIVYDINPLSLSFINKLLKTWDGKNYKKFISENFDYTNLELYCGDRFLKNNSRQIDELGEDFLNWWRNNQNERPEFCIVRADLLTPSTWNKITSYLEPGKTAIINISNIYHYHRTSVLYSLEEKSKLIKMLDKKLSDKLGTGNLFFYGALFDKKLSGKLESMNLDISELTKNLPWRRQ